MSIRPKTRSRLLILALILFVLVAGLALAFYVRKQQNHKNLVAMRDQGLVDYAQGNYSEAIKKIGKWIKNPQNNDPDIIFKFADACLQNREVEGRVRLAIDWFGTYTRLRPNDIQGYKNLMIIYSGVRSYTEALDNADKVIDCYAKADPDAQASLKDVYLSARMIRIQSQLALTRFNEALADALAYQKINPDDLEVNRIIITAMGNLKKNSEIIPFTMAYYQAHPDTPQAFFLLSLAYSQVNDFNIEERTAAWNLAKSFDPNSDFRKRVMGASSDVDGYSRNIAAAVCVFKAASLVKGDNPITHYVSAQLDSLGYFNESIALMLKTDPKDSDPWVQTDLIARLFECDLYEEVIKRLADVSLKTQNPSASNVIMMTLKAQALILTGKKDQALAIAKDLERCPKIDEEADKIVATWKEIINHLCDDKVGDPSHLIKAINTLNSQKKSDGYIAYILGQLYAEIGEVDLAIDAFNRAKASHPTWYAPRLKLSILYLSSDQKQNAENEAYAAYQFCKIPNTISNLLYVSSVTNPNKKLSDEDISRIAEFQKQYPNDFQTLLVYIKSLVQTGKVPDAENTVKTTLAKENISLGALINLAELSHSLKLSTTEECLNAAEKKFGLGPELAFVRVGFLLDSAKPQEAFAYYEQARSKSTVSPIAWKYGLASILDRFKDPKAFEAWKSLSDDPELPKYSGYIQVLKSILNSPSAQNDRDLLAKTIDRLKNSTAENALIWRVAEARFLIKNNERESYLKAKVLLEEILKSAPSNVDARFLLAGCFDVLGDPTSAIKNLVEVTRSRSEPPYIIQLAVLYNKVRDLDNVRLTLNRLSKDQVLSDNQRIQVASLWLQIGDRDRAREISSNIPETEDNNDLNLIAAEMDMASGQTEKAEQRLKTLLKNPNERILLTAARFYLVTNRKSLAEETIKRFDELKLEPGMKEYYVGELAVFTNDFKTAIDSYAKAASLQPARSDCQIAYILALLQYGNIEKAVSVAEQASRTVINYKPLEDFRKLRPLLISLSANNLANRLAREVLRNHTDSAVASQAINVLYNVQKSPKNQQIEKLKPLADSAPRLFPLQDYLANLYEQVGKRDEAGKIAIRAAQSNPDSAESAMLASVTLYRMGEFRQSLAYADKWKNLAPDQTLAILMGVDDLFNLGENDEALKRIEPLFKQYASDKSEIAGIIHQKRLSALARKNNVGEIEQFLKPFITEEYYRVVALSMTTYMTDPAAVGRIIDMVAATVPKDKAIENIRITVALQEAGIRLKQDSFVQRAKTLVRKIADENPQNSDIISTAGIESANNKDFVEAENYYRKALSVNPKNLVAVNNLVMLLAEQNRGLDEALSLLNQLSDSEKTTAVLDTQSLVYLQKKEYAKALEIIGKAVDADPSNTEYRLRQIEILIAANKLPEANEALRIIDNIHKSYFEATTLERLAAARAKLKS